MGNVYKFSVGRNKVAGFLAGCQLDTASSIGFWGRSLQNGLEHLLWKVFAKHDTSFLTVRQSVVELYLMVGPYVQCLYFPN